MSINNQQSKANKKQVLQQSNCNLEVHNDKQGSPKFALDKNSLMLVNKDEMAFESENVCGSQKKPERIAKPEAKSLRNIRLDISSLKRSVIQRTNAKSQGEYSTDESSEDESKKSEKQRPIVPNYVTNSDTGPCRKPRQSRQDALLLSSQNPKLVKSQPLSIARRNARERNRVKQVNEGFAALRNRIPEYISEAYNEEKGRKSAKKLSKVETLRMAVDYIRHLETLLDLKSTEKDIWIKQIKTETQPWETPSSSVDYPSPVDSKYQHSSTGSPGTSYDQAFEYHDRIFYDYDLEFMPRKTGLPSDEKPLTFAVHPLSEKENENECVDDFKYYETFNRLKKENIDDENLVEENLENFDISQRESDFLPKNKDVIKKISKNTVLPSITESFNKGIAVFY